MIRFIRSGLLMAIISFATMLWLAGKIMTEVSKHPQVITGTKPIGAAPVVKVVAKKEIWFLVKIRKWMGRYVQKYHPSTHLRLKSIF